MKENIQGIHTCYICGKSIQPIEEEFIETKRDTKIWVHRECVPKGRKENGKTTDKNSQADGCLS